MTHADVEHLQHDAPGAIVLCGGRGRRMGRDKATLPVDGIPMLLRVIEAVSRCASPVVVAARPGQALPELCGLHIVTDERADAGPLEGLRVGLNALRPTVATAVVAACDQPLLSADLYDLLLRRLDRDVEGVVPRVAGRVHPLSAVYRTRLAPLVERLMQSGERRAMALAALPGVRVIDETDEPRLAGLARALVNVNTPAALAALQHPDSGGGNPA